MQDNSQSFEDNLDVQVRQLPDDGQTVIQEAETLPLQSEDTGQEAMTMMRAEGATDRAPTPQEDNAMLFGGSVLLALLLIAVIAYFITKSSRESTKQDKQSEKSTEIENKKEQ